MNDYLKQVAEQAAREKPFVEKHLETDIWKLQKFLHMKAAWTAVLEKIDAEKYYYVRKGDKFGFSEQMVNQLLVLAYTKGVLESSESQRQRGYADAMKDVATKLGFEDHE